ncbi:hypothetical protein JL722_4907 [Aureococcus anophagefferens]|nr:hypothetical protein JL722_4907 [Aureococcus anophagefferens]
MAPAAVDLDSSSRSGSRAARSRSRASPRRPPRARPRSARAPRLGAAAAAAAIFVLAGGDASAAAVAAVARGGRRARAGAVLARGPRRGLPARGAAGDDSDDDAAVLARVGRRRARARGPGRRGRGRAAGLRPAPARELRPAAGLGDADAAGAALDALDSTTACAVLDGRTGRRASPAPPPSATWPSCGPCGAAAPATATATSAAGGASPRSTRVARAVRGSSEGAPARFDARASGERKAVLRRVDWDVDVPAPAAPCRAAPTTSGTASCASTAAGRGRAFEARGVPGDYERAGPDEGRDRSERKRAKARKRRLRRNKAHVAGLASPRLAAPEAPARRGSRRRRPTTSSRPRRRRRPRAARRGAIRRAVGVGAPRVRRDAGSLQAVPRDAGPPQRGLCLDAIAEYRRRHVDSTPEQTRLRRRPPGRVPRAGVDDGRRRGTGRGRGRARRGRRALDASSFDGLEHDVDALLAASVEAFRLEKPVVVEGRAPPRPDAAALEPTPSRGRRAVRYVRDMLRSLSPRKKRPAEGGLDAASADATAAAPAAAPSTPTRRPAGADESALKRLFRSLSPSAPRLWSRSPARSPRRSPPPRARSPARFSLGRLLPRWGRRSRSPDAHAVPSTPEPPSQPPQATT